MSIVHCQKVSRIFGKGERQVQALTNINLDIPEGQFLAIVGPSGSGKSTLMHLLAGLDSPTSGKVVIDGVDLSHLKERELAVFRRRKVGLIYQFFNLIPSLTVRQNILLPQLLDKRPIDEKAFSALVTRLGLKEKVSAYPGELSGGQAQRVAIARALSYHPALLLADEPTGNLDRENSDIIVDLLKEANTFSGQTIVLITHDERLALIADRIITMEDGVIHRDEVIQQ